MHTCKYTSLYIFICVDIYMHNNEWPTEGLEIHQKEKYILFDTKLLNFQIVYC